MWHADHQCDKLYRTETVEDNSLGLARKKSLKCARCSAQHQSDPRNGVRSGAQLLCGAIHRGTGAVKSSYVDTLDQSEIGFGVTKLLGFDLLLRIKRINRCKVYRPHRPGLDHASGRGAIVEHPPLRLNRLPDPRPRGISARLSTE